MEGEINAGVQSELGIEILPENFADLPGGEAVPILERGAGRLQIIYGKENEFWNGIKDTMMGMATWIGAGSEHFRNKTVRAISGVALAATLVSACQPVVTGSSSTDTEKPGAQTVEVAPQDSRAEPQQILADAFTHYEDLRVKNPALGELKYRKPVNFMEFTDALGKAPSIEGMETNDVDGSSFLKFSVEDIKGPESLIKMNPGSGEVDQIVLGIRNNFGLDPYENPEVLERPEVLAFINTSFSEWFTETQNYVLDIKKTRKATVDDLLLHFLVKNDGDITGSLWDTTLFLKVAARNNPKDLSFGPQLDNIKFLARNIQDDFSEEPLSSVLKKKGDPYAPNGIVARAGILYHSVNVIALEGSMDKGLVELALRKYYWSRSGEEGEQPKMDADMRVAGFAPQIIEQLTRYNK